MFVKILLAVRVKIKILKSFGSPYISAYISLYQEILEKLLKLLNDFLIMGLISQGKETFVGFQVTGKAEKE